MRLPAAMLASRVRRSSPAAAVPGLGGQASTAMIT
jgi:hypothetical protein